MAITKTDIINIKRHIIYCKKELLTEQPFYAIILMNVKMVIDINAPTAYTDGLIIAFGPEFIKNLSDGELKFIMLHELMHIVFKHTSLRSRMQYNPDIYNIACDIVINSNIMHSYDDELSTISINNEPSMHLAPNNEEGYLFTTDEVYRMLIDKCPPGDLISLSTPSGSAGAGGSNRGNNNQGNNSSNKKSGKGKGLDINKVKNGIIDDHSKWKDDVDDDDLIEVISDAYLTLGKGCGNLPGEVVRNIDKLIKPKLDWKTILQNFLEFEVNDYSFNPPDKRYGDSSFFLPDFNDQAEFIRNIGFFVDTSGSITPKALISVYSEIKGAIDQFNGKIDGKLAFFDAIVYDTLYDLDKITDIRKIKPIGAGGTDFSSIFKYIDKKKMELACIIIMTDGICEYPNIKVTHDVPVLWIIVNSGENPPWGKVIHIDD